MNSNIQYRGEVTIKVSGKPNKTRKNSGTINLFKNICNVLSGMYNDTAHAKKLLYAAIPQQINIRYYDADETQISITPIRILSHDVETEDDESSASVSFYAILHGSNISSNTNSTSDIIMELQCDDNTILATAILKKDGSMYNYIKEMKLNSQCEIQWKLTFSNSTSQSEGTT
jgi:hypothetical protein